MSGDLALRLKRSHACVSYWQGQRASGTGRLGIWLSVLNVDSWDQTSPSRTNRFIEAHQDHEHRRNNHRTNLAEIRRRLRNGHRSGPGTPDLTRASSAGPHDERRAEWMLDIDSRPSGIGRPLKSQRGRTSSTRSTFRPSATTRHPKAEAKEPRCVDPELLRTYEKLDPSARTKALCERVLTLCLTR